MKNFIQPGENLDFIAPTGGVVSGQGLLLGNIFGVVCQSAAAGEECVMSKRGVYSLPKASVAWSAWDKLYWDAEEKQITNIPTGNHYIGVAVKAALLAATEAEVLLIADPLSVPSRVFSLVAPTGGVEKGKGYILNNMFVVALEDADAAASFNAEIGGEQILPKNATQATNQGTKLYWNTTNRNLTTTVATNYLVGVALEAKLAADTTQRVLLDGIATIAEPA